MDFYFDGASRDAEISTWMMMTRNWNRYDCCCWSCHLSLKCYWRATDAYVLSDFACCEMNDLSHVCCLSNSYHGVCSLHVCSPRCCCCCCCCCYDWTMTKRTKKMMSSDSFFYSIGSCCALFWHLLIFSSRRYLRHEPYSQ